ncbi:folate carrier protein [Striga asiatica]|uniref:Folate carrier protein n=1 Tax=Striga asiatica TaxID=4170 RepID=A0A5A7QVB4_STRAF|nr:folate carrier protein [Striga asiatica]
MAVAWQWENAAAGSAAGLATVTFTHPLDVIRTRFQVNDGRLSALPTYKNTPHALFTIARTEGLRGLYAGFYPAVLGSTISWGLYFYFYNKAKQRYLRNREELSPVLHLASAAEAGGLVCLCTNPIWLVKTRLQLQTPQQARTYSGFHGFSPALVLVLSFTEFVFTGSSSLFRASKSRSFTFSTFCISDAIRTILKEEGWRSLYKGLVPGLFLVTHGAIQFTAYEELRKMVVNYRTKENGQNSNVAENLLDSFDYAVLGASSKFVAILLTYPFQVIRARLQQRPNIQGIPRYVDSLHVLKETARFEGVRGFYKGITANVLKNAPAASITFIVYENVLNMLKLARKKDS